MLKSLGRLGCPLETEFALTLSLMLGTVCIFAAADGRSAEVQGFLQSADRCRQAYREITVDYWYGLPVEGGLPYVQNSVRLIEWSPVSLKPGIGMSTTNGWGVARRVRW